MNVQATCEKVADQLIDQLLYPRPGVKRPRKSQQPRTPRRWQSWEGAYSTFRQAPDIILPIRSNSVANMRCSAEQLCRSLGSQLGTSSFLSLIFGEPVTLIGSERNMQAVSSFSSFGSGCLPKSLQQLYTTVDAEHLLTKTDLDVQDVWHNIHSAHNAITDAVHSRYVIYCSTNWKPESCKVDELNTPLGSNIIAAK